MSKNCKKCGVEMPTDSKEKVCNTCKKKKKKHPILRVLFLGASCLAVYRVATDFMEKIKR